MVGYIAVAAVAMIIVLVIVTYYWDFYFCDYCWKNRHRLKLYYFVDTRIVNWGTYKGWHLYRCSGCGHEKREEIR
jgi:uncharacterized membrane protein YedE/YeeE